LSRKFFAKDLIKSDLKLIEFALQSAHEAGVAQGRKDTVLGLTDREWLVSEKKTLERLIEGSSKFDCHEVWDLKSRLWNIEEELAALPPQGDKK
jgi:hypothetical protein